MAKLLVVRGRDSFSALSRHGRRVREGPLTVVHLAAPTEPRVAFSINRKVGSAVVRNRLRRRLRAQWQRLDVPTGDYLIVTGPAAAGLGSSELGGLLRGLVARLEAA
jgi:ribonuclease P protein component